MIHIDEAKRLVKRALLSNIVSEKTDLAITPLISGQHGIGKSQMLKRLAEELGGICLTIEGGTLKEGEITGLPYQYKDEDGQIRFRFLPYYVVERIQREEQRIFEALGGAGRPVSCLDGDENRYALNDLSVQQKLAAIQAGQVRLVIIFIDEINRTESTVYRELMNILLTRSVNGYRFPWWVLFVGAMNPSTQNSVYATNEMDPAQLDRFLKIKVGSHTGEWLKFARSAGISPEIRRFIKENPKCLSSHEKGLDDEEKPVPSPRGWDMIDTILSGEPLLRSFFTDAENDARVVEKDLKALVSAKLGTSVATMFFASLVSKFKAVSPEDIFADDAKLTGLSDTIHRLSAAQKIQTCDLMLQHLKENTELMMLDKKRFETVKQQLTVLVRLLDASTRLLFAQNLSATTSDDGQNLLELWFDVFERELVDMLDLSDRTRRKIESGQ